MAMQFILGPSGSGKSDFIYKKIIEESIKNPKINYILLVPEQYSMALQRKIVMLHPNMGTMNIDVIGFNRLAYRVFDELSVKPANVLEDFGKTMLIRKLAGNLKNELKVYGECLDKNGFIDEAKSLMSEMYQYDIDKERLEKVVLSMKQAGENLLTDKLTDMLAIFKAFDTEMAGEYIVAEQITELLASLIERSEHIKKSVIVMDGFTGFTPIQLKLLRELIKNARDVFAVFTTDRKSMGKERVSEHELFYLSRQTIDGLREIAGEENVEIKEAVFLENDDKCRWSSERSDLLHLEKNIFRFPYKAYDKEPQNIRLDIYDNPRSELEAVASKINSLVMREGYRYKDIAVISGNLEEVDGLAAPIFARYDIPYFADCTTPVKNNAYVDAIGHLLRILNEDFSYDSVFSFLKSGILKALCDDDIEELENYVLKKNIKGKYRWEKEFDEKVEDTRKYVMDILLPFSGKLGKRKHKASDFIEAIADIMDVIGYEEGLAENKKVYDGLMQIFDKMKLLMPDDKISIDEFREILDVGLKELTLGRIPQTLDMVLVGDITRTRLEDVKVLFVISLNDGIIPKNGASPQIISDAEKEELALLGIRLAPTEKTNSYMEQFYLYLNMTKPSNKLYLSYTKNTASGEGARPSYIVSRIQRVFPRLCINESEDEFSVSSKKGSVNVLIDGIRRLLSGEESHMDEVLSLYKLYMDIGDEKQLEKIESAFNYNNIPQKLSRDVKKLLSIKCLSQSVSRIEKYAKCAYSYFLKYILSLQERNIGMVDDRDIGNILHTAMENLYRHVKDNLDNDWEGLTSDNRDRLVTNFVYNAFDRDFDLDGRNDYLRETLARIGRRTAKVMSDMTISEKFSPQYFEYKFSEALEPDTANKITISGIVDRGDVYYSKENNALMLRIIDYKSGNHEFDISKLYDGLQLQLAVYMHIMKRLAAKDNCTDKAEVTVLPEGMYYYQMQDPFVDAENMEKAEKEREKKLTLKGIDNRDSKRLDACVSYSVKKINDIVSDMLKGDISKNPMKDARQNACDYCEFKSVCRFDDKAGGNKYRYPTYSKKDKDRVFERIFMELIKEDE